MKKGGKNGFSLLELLLTLGLVGLIVIPLVMTYRVSYRNQALRVSAEKFANRVGEAHVYAREARDKKEWCLRRKTDQDYVLVAGTREHNEVVSTYSLEKSVMFAGDFNLWFEIGTGRLGEGSKVKLVSEYGGEVEIELDASGFAEVGAVR